ncbi:MAG: phosphatase PAP2 family protein, partial [Planctomycetes bacterium]|nr:phosphatase PAP2 family protein [Planctomycetota bacterium]
ETLRSFPSGHTATAVAMAIGLSYVYPRGRVVFFFMALLASFQRLMSGAHYLSDILASVAMSVLLGSTWLVLRQRLIRGSQAKIKVGEQ